MNRRSSNQGALFLNFYKYVELLEWQGSAILIERFNGTLRREVLNAEWFTSIKQAQTVIKTWLKQYNHIPPHQVLNMRPPVPETLSGNDT